MMTTEALSVHIQIIGGLLISLSFIHVIFPWYFNWKEELKPLSLMNKQMMQVHTFFIGLTVFMIGILCVHSTEELIETELGQLVSLGLGSFWLIRLFIQLFVYSTKLWKGKTFETIVHIVFSLFWFYMSAIFLMNYIL